MKIAYELICPYISIYKVVIYDNKKHTLYFSPYFQLVAAPAGIAL
jgi:hypothetical protein